MIGPNRLERQVLTPPTSEMATVWACTLERRSGRQGHLVLERTLGLLPTEDGVT